MAVVDMARLGGMGRRFGHRIADVVGTERPAQWNPHRVPSP